MLPGLQRSTAWDTGRVHQAILPGVNQRDSTYGIRDNNYDTRDSPYSTEESTYCIRDGAYSTKDSAYNIRDNTYGIQDSAYGAINSTYSRRDCAYNDNMYQHLKYRYLEPAFPPIITRTSTDTLRSRLPEAPLSLPVSVFTRPTAPLHLNMNTITSSYSDMFGNAACNLPSPSIPHPSFAVYPQFGQAEMKSREPAQTTKRGDNLLKPYIPMQYNHQQVDEEISLAWNEKNFPLVHRYGVQLNSRGDLLSEPSSSAQCPAVNIPTSVIHYAPSNNYQEEAINLCKVRSPCDRVQPILSSSKEKLVQHSALNNTTHTHPPVVNIPISTETMSHATPINLTIPRSSSSHDHTKLTLSDSNEDILIPPPMIPYQPTLIRIEKSLSTEAINLATQGMNPSIIQTDRSPSPMFKNMQAMTPCVIKTEPSPSPTSEYKHMHITTSYVIKTECSPSPSQVIKMQVTTPDIINSERPSSPIPETSPTSPIQITTSYIIKTENSPSPSEDMKMQVTTPDIINTERPLSPVPETSPMQGTTSSVINIECPPSPTSEDMKMQVKTPDVINTERPSSPVPETSPTSPMQAMASYIIKTECPQFPTSETNTNPTCTAIKTEHSLSPIPDNNAESTIMNTERPSSLSPKTITNGSYINTDLSLSPFLETNAEEDATPTVIDTGRRHSSPIPETKTTIITNCTDTKAKHSVSSNMESNTFSSSEKKLQSSPLKPRDKRTNSATQELVGATVKDMHSPNSSPYKKKIPVNKCAESIKSRPKVHPSQKVRHYDTHNFVNRSVVMPRAYLILKRVDLNTYQCVPFINSNNSDKHYYQQDPKHEVQCRLCNTQTKSIVSHYKQDHPHQEVFISRLSPADTSNAIVESKVNFSPTDATTLCCRFCSFSTKNSIKFYDHTTSHTGEFRFECPECQFSAHSKVIVTVHIKKAHQACVDKIIISKRVGDCKKLPGFVCSVCNFVQLNKESIKNHMDNFHGDTSIKEIKKINMASYIPVEEKEPGKPEEPPHMTRGASYSWQQISRQLSSTHTSTNNLTGSKRHGRRHKRKATQGLDPAVKKKLRKEPKPATYQA